MEAGYKHTEKHTARGLDFPSTAWGKKKKHLQHSEAFLQRMYFGKRMQPLMEKSKIPSGARGPASCSMVIQDRERGGGGGRDALHCTQKNLDSTGCCQGLVRGMEVWRMRAEMMCSEIGRGVSRHSHDMKAR